MWTNLLARQPIAEGDAAKAVAWESRSRHGILRLTSSPVLGVAAAVGMLVYLLSGLTVIFVLVVLLAVGFVVSFAFWGGLNAWTMAGRPTRAGLRPQQHLDRAAVIHRSVAVGDVGEGQREVEDTTRVDGAREDVGEQIGDVVADRSDPAQ